MIKTDAPEIVRPDYWMAWQDETNAWGMGETENEAIEAMKKHRRYDPVIELETESEANNA